MRRLVLPAVATLLALSVSGPVGASGDYGCYPAWKLPSRDFDCADRAVLSPGNDSRVNLFYLLRDRQGLGSTGAKRPTDSWNDGFYGSAFFDWRQLRGTFYPAVATDEAGGDYAGSRCVSLASGGQAFAAAMTANAKLSAWEREQLLMARGGLVRRCQATGAEATGWPANVKSAPGREFLGYLQAADAFYGEQWDAARQGFATLRSARDPWVAETAAYMLGRTELNAAQAAAFDEYGSFAGPAKVDTAALARASAGLQDYLKRYARGRYAASAGGLRRRTLWLAGDAAALSREYERLLAAIPGGQKGAADRVEADVDQRDLELSVLDQRVGHGGVEQHVAVRPGVEADRRQPRYERHEQDEPEQHARPIAPGREHGQRIQERAVGSGPGSDSATRALVRPGAGARGRLVACL